MFVVVTLIYSKRMEVIKDSFITSSISLIQLSFHFLIAYLVYDCVELLTKKSIFCEKSNLKVNSMDTSNLAQHCKNIKSFFSLLRFFI